jgi:hypothetical protein
VRLVLPNRKVGIGLVAFFWLSANVARATPDAGGVPGLIPALRRTTTLRSHFHEEKRMAVLAVPLVSEGELYFAAPDRLARVVTAPSPSKMVIEGARLSFRDEHDVRSIPLEQTPVARMLVESLMKILAGDQDGLAALYEMTLTGHPGGRWRLVLKPRTGPLNELIEDVALSGHGAIVEQLEVRETGGDDTLTSLSAVERDRPFSAEENRRFFGIDPHDAP